MTKRTREYSAWLNLRNRCNNPRNKDFADYGGRGIYVCERWNSYQNFLEDMGPKPENYSIDRLDVNGPYAPWNCQWKSASDQQKNKRPIVGRTQSVFNNKTGIKYATLTKGGRYQSTIKIKGKSYACGTFDTAQEAHDAALAKRAQVLLD